MKVTFTYNGTRYCDFEVVTPNLEFIQRYNYAVGNEERAILSNSDNAMVDLTQKIVPADKSNLYIAQPCPLCNADIRKHYGIKRSPDTADYCVVSPNYNLWYSVHTSFATVVVPVLNQVYCFFGRQYAATHSIRSHVDYCTSGTITDKDMVEIPELVKFNFCNGIPEFYRDWFASKISKPVVYYENLNMDTGNVLNPDLLYLIYKTANGSRSKDDCDKLILQLQSLNQHNWRDYPGTLGILFKYMIGHNGPAYYKVAWTESKLPKAVKQFAWMNIDEPNIENMSHDDFELSRHFLSQILNLNDTKYVTIDSLINKVNEFHIPINVLNSFFNVAVRIAPKTNN